MPTIELTEEQAEELRDVLAASLKSITEDHRMFDPSNADDIASFHRLSVLNDILELLEVA